MYAVIANGGKQYKVTEGQLLKLEKFVAEPGSRVVFDQVLMLADGDDIKVGAPFVDKMSVTAEVIEHGRDKKIKIIKFKRRKHHMKQMGHRQGFTQVKITAIGAGSKQKMAVAEEAGTNEIVSKQVEAKTTAPKLKKAAVKKPAVKKPAKAEEE